MAKLLRACTQMFKTFSRPLADVQMFSIHNLDNRYSLNVSLEKLLKSLWMVILSFSFWNLISLWRRSFYENQTDHFLLNMNFGNFEDNWSKSKRYMMDFWDFYSRLALWIDYAPYKTHKNSSCTFHRVLS